MEVGMCVRAVAALPVSNSWKAHEDHGFLKGASSFLPTRTGGGHERRQGAAVVVEAKGKRGGGMQSRQFQRQPPPPLPKVEEDGNPKFVIFIRTANVYLWYPLSLITGGTTAKIMVAAKDNFLGKYIYKDTIARNIAAVIYRDEKEIQKTALKQFRVLRSATEFRYGYKLVENGNVRAALSPSNVIELPRQEELKTVLDKVKDFFGEATSGAKESFGKLTAIDSVQSSEAEPKSEVKS
ncbi:protein HHL1, chloroplastic [Iris pallida]|uniref:Protein HHL1, chloroplastic n=1 Tax=Iris pallida TaxID=29817 RepID=A0AAX6HSC2_IRIPA|nr:protein HHL1, chloroplastic [Iris pallida]